MGRIEHEHYKDKHHGTKNIRIAFFLNVSFTIIEIIGGIMTNSMAIISDALHDLGDSLSLGLAWYFQKLSQKKPDARYSYGYGRFSLLGAIVNSVVLVAGSAIILINTIPRIINPVQPETKGMIMLAILGVIINGIAFLRLKKGNSLNERVISLHLIEDVLGWVVVLIASIVMHYKEMPRLDAILSLGIALWILSNVYRNLKEAFRIVLQATPKDVDLELIQGKVEKIESILNVHDLHVWSLDGSYNILSIDIVADEKKTLAELEEIKEEIKHCLSKENIHHFTVEFDSPKVLEERSKKEKE